MSRYTRSQKKILAVFAVCTLLLQAQSVRAYPVAGLTPSHRPESAPVVAELPNQAQLEKQLLHGVNEPVPEGMQRWINDQGAWFTPFSHPGIPGRYDLRKWHDIQ